MVKEDEDPANDKACAGPPPSDDDEWELLIEPLEPVDIVHNNGYEQDDGMILLH